MDFAPSPRGAETLAALGDFMAESVYPAEAVYAEQRRTLAAAGHPHARPAVVEELKTEARHRGLWNLFLPSESGLSVLDYAPIAELTGRSPDLAPEALNCSAPDTGNMELLHLFGTPEQKRTGLEPLKRLSTTLIQTLQYGTPLASALRVLSAELRGETMTRFEEKAAKLPVLLTIPMILFILPCLFLVVGGPAIVQVLAMMHG